MIGGILISNLTPPSKESMVRRSGPSLGVTGQDVANAVQARKKRQNIKSIRTERTKRY